MYVTTGQPQSISRIGKMGANIKLLDRSVWKVSLFDTSRVMMWSAGDKVTVSASILNKYKITNTRRGETIEVEFTK